ncbi:hypothetical protein KR51_00024100 [Rubidibacter lacunae KORDI 51-2]|uniref:Uncharacterized protein n=1 Tax=Rubidibacter lacunae KORDI 51-2 TaxID=582515 RepID=U5DHN8_9CHRO|nr:hypothetical protein KR51_00024100 [Rubidibacter lacunae KORDI 51-2]
MVRTISFDESGCGNHFDETLRAACPDAIARVLLALNSRPLNRQATAGKNGLQGRWLRPGAGKVLDSDVPCQNSQ